MTKAEIIKKFMKENNLSSNAIAEMFPELEIVTKNFNRWLNSHIECRDNLYDDLIWKIEHGEYKITKKRVLKLEDNDNNSIVPNYVLHSLTTYGNTIITYNKLKEIGGKRKFLKELKNEGFDVTVNKPNIVINGIINEKEADNEKQYYIVNTIRRENI